MLHGAVNSQSVAAKVEPVLEVLLTQVAVISDLVASDGRVKVFLVPFQVSAALEILSVAELAGVLFDRLPVFVELGLFQGGSLLQVVTGRVAERRARRRGIFRVDGIVDDGVADGTLLDLREQRLLRLLLIRLLLIRWLLIRLLLWLLLLLLLLLWLLELLMMNLRRLAAVQLLRVQQLMRLNDGSHAELRRRHHLMPMLELQLLKLYVLSAMLNVVLIRQDLKRL